MYLQSNIKSECFGCGACVSVCRSHALQMRADEEGFLYPIKDDDKCTQCGLCYSVCPFEKESLFHNESANVYAGYVTNENERCKSSSGGMFFEIAKEVFNEKGAVYGAAFTKDFTLNHIKATTINSLQPIRGSKYVQSIIPSSVYEDIKSLLKRKSLVYFTGTPCQVAAVRSVMSRWGNTGWLLTSDLICHGVPSQKIFKAHLDYIKQKLNAVSIEEYRFRDNTEWGGCEIVVYLDQKNRKRTFKLPSYELSPFLYSFMYAMTYRPSCYCCPYANPKRVGDITLGDFWGVEKVFPQLDASKGVSCLIVNTSHGNEILGRIKNEMVLCKSYLNVALENNTNLQRPSRANRVRGHVYKDLDTYGYSLIARKYFLSPNRHRVRFLGLLKTVLGNRIYTRAKKLILKYSSK